ncbi:MAG: rRNA maturation RNase YbeY [Acidobacteriota bacterium]|jgi:probable rRNA maturation factor|nr:rRNA maturation RNase YbeY [Acidobacteriota bacterium]
MTSKLKKRNPATEAIQARNRQRRIGIDLRAVELFAVALLESLHLTGRMFDVVFVGAPAMRRLNRDWRKKDYATDVLSFAYDGELVDGKPFLGEIVIAPEVAVRQAVRYGVEPEKEIRKLLVHGVLHLMGYDHEADNGDMERMQNRILRRRFFTTQPPSTLLTPLSPPSPQERSR